MTDRVKERSQPGYWAEYLPHWEEPLAEGFQRASCSPACKAIATCAVGAWDRGWTARQWREDVLSNHPEKDEVSLITEAEECMRSSGLWPWSE